ncbi:MAG: hypothetical protein MN733_06025 [Nitrososphaera sp.]|nr:hypothetical protein [Nitrososphaera sp.]
MTIALLSSFFSGVTAVYSQEVGQITIDDINGPDNTIFDPGDEITISGSVYGVTDGEIELTIINTSDEDDPLPGQEGKSVQIQEDGTFSYPLTLPEEEDLVADLNICRVDITYGDEEASAFFNILVEITLEIEPPTTEQAEYAPGDAVTIDGVMNGADDGDKMFIDVTNEDGEKVVDRAQATVTDEEYTYTFTLPSDAIGGLYTVDVDYKGEGELTDLTEFTVTGSGSGSDQQTLTVKTEFEEYEPSDRVKISGTVAGAENADIVDITVFGPDDKPIPAVDDKGVSITNEAFSLTFDLDPDADLGTYEVEIDFGGEKKSATFKVLDLDAVEIPSDAPVIQLTKKAGTIRVQVDGDEFTVGDQVKVSGTVEGADDEDEVQISVFGPDNEILDKIEKDNRLILDEKYSFSFNIPRDAEIGTYKVLVEAGGDEEDTIFTLIGSGGGSDDPFTVSTDKAVYAPGDRVEIGGKVEDATDGTEVVITAFGTDGEELDRVDGETDSIRDEEYSFSFTLDADAPLGVYKVLAEADGDEEDTIFTVSGSGGGGGDVSAVTVDIDAATRTPGQSILITGTVDGAITGDQVHITIFGPDGDPLGDANELVVDITDEAFAKSYALSTDALGGGYAVEADFEGDTAYAFFDVLADGDGGGGGPSTEVLTDQTEYDPGGTAVVSGTILDAADGDPVNLIVRNPDAGEEVNVELVISSEEFSHEFVLPGGAIGGIYEVEAAYGTEESAVFTYFVVVLNSPLSLGVEEESYLPGDEVTITGMAEGAEDDQIVDLTVLDPDLEALFQDETVVIAGEAFSLTFTLASNAIPGRYQVSGIWYAEDELGATIFTVEAEGTGGEITPTIKSGNTEYDPDDLVELTGTVVGAADNDIIKVSVFDPSGAVLAGVNEESVIISSESFSFDFNLASDAPEGLYRIKGDYEGAIIFNYFSIGGQDAGGGDGSFSVGTKDPLYNPGDDIEIVGSVISANDGEKVRITVEDPGEDTVSKANGKSVDIFGGQFEFTFGLSSNADQGVYRIEAEFENEEIFGYFDVEKADFEIEIETDEIEYEPGDEIEISGTVEGADEGEKVEITVTDPNGEVVDEVDGKTDRIAKEEFQLSFDLNDDAEIGVYMIQVTFDEDEKFGYFDVLGERKVEIVQVATGENSYSPGDAITVAGLVIIAAADDRADISVYDPFDAPLELVHHTQVKLTDQQFTHEFDLSNYAPEGVYDVHVIYREHLGVTKFQVIADSDNLSIEGVPAGSTALILGPYGIPVNLVTTSGLKQVLLDEENKSLSLAVEGKDDVPGSVKISIGRILKGPYVVYLDGSETQEYDLTGDDESQDATIEIEYAHSDHEIQIIGTQVIPEFPPIAIGVIAAVIIGLVAIGGRTSLFRHTYPL